MAKAIILRVTDANNQLARLRRIYDAAGQAIDAVDVLLREVDWKMQNGGDARQLKDIEEKLREFRGMMSQLRQSVIEKVGELMLKHAAIQFLDGDGRVMGLEGDCGGS